MRRLCLLLFLALAAPAPAQWSAPEPIPESGGAVRPQVAVTAAEQMRIAWATHDGVALSSGAGPGRLVARGRDYPSGPVAYAGRRFALAFTDVRRTRLEVLLHDRRHAVAGGRRLVRPVIAANLRGDVAVAWFDDRGTSNDEVLVSIRRAGGGFGRPVRLARERVRGVSVAVGPRGDVLVAWDAYGKVRARLRDPGGQRFRTTETIRSDQAYSARLQTALTARGRALIGWSAQFTSEGGDHREAFTQVAVRPAGGRRFRAAQRLARDRARLAPDGGVRLAAGGTAVGWTQGDGVYVSVADARAVFGPPRRIAPAGALLEDLVAGAGLLAVWTHAGALRASLDLGAAETVAAAGAGRADAAHGRSAGRFDVVWEQDGRAFSASRG